MKRSLLASISLFVLVSFAPTQEASTGAPLVAEVIIQGCRDLSREKLLRYLDTKPNRIYSEKVLRDDFARLAASHLCRPVDVRTEQTRDGRVNVIFVIEEFRNVVREVLYKHNKHVSSAELRKISRVTEGMPMNKDQNKRAAFDIRDHLKEEGYYFANVTLLEGFEDHHERVIFNITEGPKVRVRNTIFRGQSELASAQRLRSQIDTSRAFLGTFSGSFREESPTLDVARLVEYYRANGYLNVKVGRELKFTDNYQYVDIIFHIQEGPRFRIAECTVQASREFRHPELMAVLRVKAGDTYNEALIKTDVRNLTEYGGWRGYDLNVKTSTTEVPEHPGFVRVQYLVEHKSN